MNAIGVHSSSLSLVRSNDSAVSRFVRGFTVRHRDWLAANEVREQLRAAWRDFFRRFDALLCPISPVAAQPHTQEGEVIARQMLVNGKARSYIDQIVWAGVIGMAYLPAVVAPVGRTKAGSSHFPSLPGR